MLGHAGYRRLLHLCGIPPTAGLCSFCHCWAQRGHQSGAVWCEHWLQRWRLHQGCPSLQPPPTYKQAHWCPDPKEIILFFSFHLFKIVPNRVKARLSSKPHNPRSSTLWSRCQGGCVGCKSFISEAKPAG